MDIHYCDIYHPYKYLNDINPSKNKLTHKMMDFKNDKCEKHVEAVEYFKSMVLDFMDDDVFSDLVRDRFQVAVVPSHECGRVSPALIYIAESICDKYEHAIFTQSLERHTTVPSAHKENGERSIEVHMDSISVVGDVENEWILLLDDVTTTGVSMQACSNLLLDSNAFHTVGLAILQTADYGR